MTRSYVARVDTAGNLDAAFDPVADNDGKILLGGEFMKARRRRNKPR